MGVIFWIIFSFFTFCLGLIFGTVVKKRDAKLNEFNKQSEEWWNDTTEVKDEDFFKSGASECNDDFFTNKKSKKTKNLKINVRSGLGPGPNSQVVMGGAYKEIRKMILKLYGINVTNDRQFREIKRRLDRD